MRYLPAVTGLLIVGFLGQITSVKAQVDARSAIDGIARAHGMIDALRKQAEGPAQARISGHPSFGCEGKLSPVAQILCTEKTGAKTDWELNSALWAIDGVLSPGQKQAWETEQQAWRKSVDVRCTLVPGAATFTMQQRYCVLDMFRQRVPLLLSKLSGDAQVEAKLTPEQHLQIQQSLVSRNFLSEMPDGEFGPTTRQAIKQFQSSKGSEPTGILTLAQRDDLLGIKKPPTLVTNQPEQLQASSRKEAIVDQDSRKGQTNNADQQAANYVREPDAFREAYDKRKGDPDFRYLCAGRLDTQSSFPACEQTLDTAKSRRQEADRCFEAQQWDCVVASTTKLMQLFLMGSPTLERPYFQRGVALSKLGKNDEALSDLHKAHQMEPNNDEINQAISSAESKPTKTDIRGFSPGMPIGDFNNRFSALASQDCLGNQASQPNAYPCFIKNEYEKNRFGARLGPNEVLQFVATQSLPDNKLWYVEYEFSSLKGIQDIADSVASQFGLPKGTVFAVGSSGDRKVQWQFGDMLLELSPVGRPNFAGAEIHYRLVLESNALKQRDDVAANQAKINAAGNAQPPKF